MILDGAQFVEATPLPERLRSWRKAAPGFFQRQARHLGQARYGWDHPRRVSFVFGCQRSGTKMVMWTLEKSPAVHIYHENHASAFRDFQLRSDALLRALVRLSPAPSQVFKPICDSHRADEILSGFPAAKGLWIYRHYDDVARSAARKWGEHQRDVIAAVAAGDLARWGWRTARLPEQVIADIRRVYRPDLTPEEGALLFWYMRNAFFFALGLDRHPRMLLVRYEDLVRDPARAFPAVFEHVGAPFEPSFTEKIRASSGRERASPAARPEIRALCEGLLRRFDAWTRPAARPPLVSPVLVLIDTLGVGGAERYAVALSNWLAQQGAKVTLAASPGPCEAGIGPGVDYRPSPLAHVRGGLPAAAVRLRRILDEVQPAVIVANSLAVTLIAGAAQIGRRVPIVTVAHGWPERRYRLVGPLMRQADLVIAVSPDVKAKLAAAGLPGGRCEVIENGVDCSNLGPREGEIRAAAREAMGAGPEDLLVAVVGRLEAQKAHQHVIQAALLLRERHPNLRFAIIGGGSRAEELVGLARAAGVEGRVRLLGMRTDVADLLGSADIYLNCSDWEGMPLTTIEAMASALPVVATRTEGSGQLLTPACGVVVPVGDAGAMASALDRLAADPALRARMGAAARERALSRFGLDRMAGELAEALAYVTGARP